MYYSAAMTVNPAHCIGLFRNMALWPAHQMPADPFEPLPSFGGLVDGGPARGSLAGLSFVQGPPAPEPPRAASGKLSEGWATSFGC